MLTIGVDVSHWEGMVQWSQAYRSIGFAYYKCTDGVSFVDGQFENNKKGCMEYGIPSAPYHWFQPDDEPKSQAKYFIDKAGAGYKKYIIDVEEHVAGQVKKLKTMLDECAQLSGVKPAIYTSAGFWNEWMKPRPEWAHEYELIVANYTYLKKPILPIGWSDFKIWQFTDNYYFFGCSQRADGDWYNGDLKSCRDWFGNYFEYEPTPPSGSEQQFVCTVPYLYIRAAPDINAPIVNHLSFGDIITGIKYGGDECWVQHDRGGWSCITRYGTRFLEEKGL